MTRISILVGVLGVMVPNAALADAKAGGRRKDDAMQTNTSGMSAEDMRDIAEYFAIQKQPRTTFRPDAAKVALGRERAEQLECASCHQADYFGRDSTPRLAGQCG